MCGTPCYKNVKLSVIESRKGRRADIRRDGRRDGSTYVRMTRALYETSMPMVGVCFVITNFCSVPFRKV